MQSKIKKVLLSIAGLDPSSGAGVFSDIKTISALGGYAMAVPTCLTVQDLLTLHSTQKISVDYISQALDKIFKLYDVVAVKIGLINDFETLEAISNYFETAKPKLVLLDPIIESSSGFKIWDKNILDFMLNKFFYHVDVITPNFYEFTKIYESLFKDELSLEKRIINLQRKYLFNIALTGAEDFSLDIINYYYDGLTLNKHEIEKTTVSDNNIHGTGCAFSAALLSFMVKEKDFLKSCFNASNYVKETVDNHCLISKLITIDQFYGKNL